MTFWEIGVGLWSMAHFGYNSGGSRGGAWGARVPLLFLDQTEAQRAEKIFFSGDHPSLISGSGWPGAAPAPSHLSEGLHLPLYNNIATTHLCLQSLCLPCSPCSRKSLRYFESQNLRLACASSVDETEYKLSDNLVWAYGFPSFNTGILSFLLLSFFFY